MRRSISWIQTSVLATGLLAGLGHVAAAGVELPPSDPSAKVAQQVGLTEVSVAYESPAVKGRKLWGSVIPYDRVWWIGSSLTPAKITFSRDVVFGDKAVPAGTYFVLATPSKSAWTIILNKSVDEPGKGYRPELDVARVRAAVKSNGHRERLLFLFTDVTEDKASLDIEWDAVHVSVPIQMQTHAQVLAAIDNLDGAWKAYQNAALYMLQKKKDYDAGLKYIDQSLALKEDWYSLWVKAALLASKNEYKDAREQAEKAYELAPKTAESSTLERELVKAISEWRKHEQKS